MPAFVATPVRRLNEVLSGPLVAEGARVVVSDLIEDDRGVEALGRALALALEAELADASYFSVVTREGALSALADEGRVHHNGFALTTSAALAILPSVSASALVTGSVARDDKGVYTVELIVLDDDGAERYRSRRSAAAAELATALSTAARDVRRRLGDAVEERGREYGPALSSSIDALREYAEARAHLFYGRYGDAIAAARRATLRDREFAAAYRAMAYAYGLAGRRARARRVLEDAWRFRDRLSEREQLRLSAERAAFAGRYTEAILTYDRLFVRYRDDASALKSQAILQGMIGARGRGLGNLRVAYSIEPVDWPPLERVARFLGYRGRLPQLDDTDDPSG